MPLTGDGRLTDQVSRDSEFGGRSQKHAAPAQIKASLFANYSAAQYHYVQFLAEHLTDCRKTLGGDFDDLMLLAVLGQRFIGARLDRDAGEAGAEDRVWMSALRLSDVTGVPRESVRRKLLRLQERGWVAYDGDHGWRLAGTLDQATAQLDLSELDKRGIDRLARMVAGLNAILSDAEINPRKADILP